MAAKVFRSWLWSAGIWGIIPKIGNWVKFSNRAGEAQSYKRSSAIAFWQFRIMPFNLTLV